MNDKLPYLKKIIEKDVFLKGEKELKQTIGGENPWLMDFRKAILQPDFLSVVCEEFEKRLSKLNNFQIGGPEVAAIPLIAALISRGYISHKLINGFFIRKSRKKGGMLKMIEGTLTNEDVVLVDDLINNGFTLERQVKALEALGKKVTMVLVIIKFRNDEQYEFFNKKNIPIVSLFTLNDFNLSLGLKNIALQNKALIPQPFRSLWLFSSDNPNFFYMLPKSAPVIDETKVYFGSDSGYFWAINQVDGQEVWKFKILGLGAKGKNIFSSPAIYKDTVYFGAYDGNFYALDKETGQKKWIFMEADWIGSSPSIAPDLGLVFVGEEFGLWKKRGGIVALDLETGKKEWAFREMLELTHCSPLYIKENKTVVIGSNDGVAYCFEAKNGKLLWKLQTGGEVKASFAFDEKRGVVCFGSHDGKMYVVDVKNGALVHTYDTGVVIYSTPCVWQDKVYFSSLNKLVYCLDLNSFALVWQLATSGRVFASPVVIEGRLYIGSNDARLYEIDPMTGEKTGMFQAVERIVNKIAYNPETRRFFLPTFANEIYCLERKEK